MNTDFADTQSQQPFLQSQTTKYIYESLSSQKQMEFLDLFKNIPEQKLLKFYEDNLKDEDPIVP